LIQDFLKIKAKLMDFTTFIANEKQETMRLIIQRVKNASVTIENKVVSSITAGMLILLGVEEADTIDDIEWLTKKVAQLRVFDDANGVMNLSIMDIVGELLVVSQFTLHASTKKGNRPSYIKAARPETAIPLYNQFVEELKKASDRPVYTGEFGAMMDVSLINDGPVTIIMDSKNKE
jgi:D-tyrosyl-tRNA(Tyr) deacylase